MMGYLFEVIGAEIRPVLPRRDRQPDGRRFLTDRECSTRSGRPVDQWRAEWIAYFSDEPDPASEPDAPGHATHEPAEDADPVAAAANVGRYAVVRQVRFPHLSDRQWDFALRECARWGVDVADVWIKLEPVDDTGEVEPKIITTILVLRQIAERTGLKEHESSPQYCGDDGAWVDVWTRAESPKAARVFVKRRDVEQPFEGVVYFDRCASKVQDEHGNVELAKAWKDSAGAPQLGKCASAAAHRMAFHGLLGSLVAKEENDPKSVPKFANPGRRAAPRPKLREGVNLIPAPPEPSPARAAVIDTPDDPRAAWALVNDTTPDSLRSLRLTLVHTTDMNVAEADEAIETYRRKLPRVFGASTTAFAAVVLKAVRERVTRAN